MNDARAQERIRKGLEKKDRGMARSKRRGLKDGSRDEDQRSNGRLGTNEGEKSVSKKPENARWAQKVER